MRADRDYASKEDCIGDKESRVSRYERNRAPKFPRREWFTARFDIDEHRKTYRDSKLSRVEDHSDRIAMSEVFAAEKCGKRTYHHVEARNNRNAAEQRDERYIADASAGKLIGEAMGDKRGETEEYSRFKLIWTSRRDNDRNGCGHSKRRDRSQNDECSSP